LLVKASPETWDARLGFPSAAVAGLSGAREAVLIIVFT
jgi:hypothetical protein